MIVEVLFVRVQRRITKLILKRKYHLNIKRSDQIVNLIRSLHPRNNKTLVYTKRPISITVKIQMDKIHFIL